MDVFDFNDYKTYVRRRLENMPRKGHGQFRKMAIFLSVNSVGISLIFNGERHLTLEQACELCDFFGFSETQSQFFVTLVERGRAGTHKLKKLLDRRLETMRVKSQELKERVTPEVELTDEVKAVFYSNWYYSAIRLLTSIDGFNSVDAVAEHFRLPTATVSRALEFLLLHGLCREEKGQIRMGPKSTHLETSSPFVSRSHINWRNKSIEKMDAPSPDAFILTMPCSISEKAMKEIRKILLNSVERVTGIIDAAPCEKLVCLSIDLFEL